MRGILVVLASREHVCILAGHACVDAHWTAELERGRCARRAPRRQVRGEKVEYA
jgi:hypothetical protein